MVVELNNKVKNNSFYINKFSTKYDKNNTRKNLFVDIPYGEMKIYYNNNKTFIELLIHVAGNFNLPQYCIRGNLISGNINIENIQFINSSLKVDDSFPYGYPDSSNIFTAKVVLEGNENIINNENIKLSFFLETNQLEGIIISKNNLDNFISNLNSSELNFKVNLENKNIIDNYENQNFKILHNYKYKLISNTFDHNFNKINSIQINDFEILNLSIKLNNEISHSIEEIFKIENSKNLVTKLRVNSIKVLYEYNNKILETNSIELNELINSNSNEIIYKLKGISLFFDEKNNKYTIEKNGGSFFVDDFLVGKIELDIDISINGKWSNYLFYSNFSFVKKDFPKIIFLNDSNEELKIKESDSYYEIKTE